MSGIIETLKYDEMEDRLIVKRSQDVESILADNQAEYNATSEFGAYKGNFVRVASVPLIVIELMRNGQCCTDGVKYDLMSPDPDERRRALMHVQEAHKKLLTKKGKPFARQRVKWQ